MNPLCARWEREPALPPRQNTVPVGSFRFTKTFTERCWSSRRSRRSRHELFRIRQNRQPQSDQRAPTFAIFDDHLRGITVKYFEPFGDIGHTDPAASKIIRMFDQLCRAHAHAIV